MNKATYVYCLVAAARRPSLAHVPAGLPGAGPVRLLDVDGSTRAGGRRWLVIADVPLARYSANAINAKLSNLDWVSRVAVEHEAVVEAFIASSAVLPMKLFTIFASDQRAAAHVASERRRIDRVLRRLAGKLEWGVRVVMPSTASATARGQSSGTGADQSGAAYLAGKKAMRDRSAQLAERARAVVDGLYHRLERRAASARRRPASELSMRDGPLLLDAAFLVAHGRGNAFRAAVDREARTLARDGYRATLNGPWPPYSFIDG